MTTDQSQQNAIDEDAKSFEIIILIGLTALAYAAIIYIVSIVMNLNWA